MTKKLGQGQQKTGKVEVKVEILKKNGFEHFPGEKVHWKLVSGMIGYKKEYPQKTQLVKSKSEVRFSNL